jgi:Spy/CpxP family protein refolding chaperone
MACRVGVVASVLLGAGATLGCGGAAASQPPAATAAPASSDDEVTAGLMEHHRHHHHGGVTLFLAMSLDTLGVSPEQRAAVERIRTELHASMEPAHVAEQNLVSVLADGLAAGAIDAAKVEAAIAQLSTAAAAVQDAPATALDELHGLLTPAQRAALADKVEAHWAVWQKANAEESVQAKPEGGHVAALAVDLDLTKDQVDTIRARLADGMKAMPPLDPQTITAHLHRFGEAFRAEQLDARALTAASSANAHLAAWGAAQMARLVEAASPVLTPEQRAAFAQRLREHATHNPSAQANP